MFQRTLFHWKSHLFNRFLHKKYFYWVSCFKIGFCDNNVNVIKRSHVKNVINQSFNNHNDGVKINF